MTDTPTILVIEDEKPILENVLEILQINDFKVFGASDGVEGVEQARQVLPDLILCDINMPEMDGYNVLMTLRSNAQTSSIPLVFLTAYVDREFQRRGMTLGAEDYLTKPFTPDELVRSVNTQLKKTQRQRQEINKLRANLLGSLPHELRTPLTGIVTCADLLIMDLEEDTFDMNRAEQTLHIIQNSGRRLQRLIENHLFHTQLEVAKRDPKQRQYIVGDSGISRPFWSVVAVAKRKAAEHGRDDDLQVGKDAEATIHINEENLIRITSELLDNAFKFSQAGTPVKLASNLQDGNFYLMVQDEGIGIHPDNIPMIGAYMQFEREYHEQQGVGLGLAIAKQLTDLHDGDLTIESQAGQGTRVILSLPCGAPG